MTGEKPVLLREFCAENMTCVPASVAAGARRIELCDNLAVGGTTPSAGVIAAAVGFCRPRGVGVMCMVRPRGGTSSTRRRRPPSCALTWRSPSALA